MGKDLTLGNPPEESLNEEVGTHALVRPEDKTKTPSFYKVLILNDDFTPREYVVHVLQKFFKKTEQEATHLMLQVHHKGMGVAGVFTCEIAETKAYQVNEYSKKNKYPLKCVVEAV
ncbi:MAG: ATP-dependent Clp protease adapter ClpS [Deltaproteobacteria bacterium]|nr:ATP-dependent Clp protease adapter ClpS [Deltaproteobacteria bacterium]MBM4317458.1 ATP-dependent Clp protease adapter ClpS [Deltaproteobacteria bacterium]